MCVCSVITTSMIYLMAMVVTINGLSITNLTSPVPLTGVFSKGYQKIPYFGQGLMTQYKSSQSQDPSIFYLMSFGSNDTDIESHVKGDVFDTTFTQSTNINNLPLDIADRSIDDPMIFGVLSGNGLCTSPVTNDILTCWINVTASFERSSYQIACRIYFTKTNTISDIIYITNTTRGQNFNSAQGNVICFDDSYLIPYIYGDYRFGNTDIIYATLLDLKGNIKYRDVQLKNISVPRNFGIDFIFATKGSKSFNAKSVNSAATDIFALTFQMYNLTNNETTTDGLYGYYTNINDPKFPITMYNDTIIQRANNLTFNGFGPPQALAGITISITQDCCYLFGYETYNYTEQYDFDNVYVMITDIYGNNIDISGLSKNEDIEVIANVSDYVPVSFIDLPMISTSDAHYFMVSYSNNTQYDEGNVTSVRIFYLQKGANNAYQLNTAGDYVVTTTVGNIPVQNQPSFDNVYIYNPPNTSLLLYTWVQEQQIVINETYSYPQEIYGQTFEIK